MKILRPRNSAESECEATNFEVAGSNPAGVTICKRCGSRPSAYKRIPWCRECKRAYDNEYYRNNTNRRDKVADYRAKYARKLWTIIVESKNKPCVDCGHQYPHYCMDFDHLDGTDKEFTISSEYTNYSEEMLRSEIEKCEVVCAICHRIRTWNRLHSIVDQLQIR